MRNPDSKELLQYDYPIHHVNSNEINNPLSVIQDFFSFAHLPEVREILWLSLKTNVTGAFPQGDELNPKVTNKKNVSLHWKYKKTRIPRYNLDAAIVNISILLIGPNSHTK